MLSHSLAPPSPRPCEVRQLRGYQLVSGVAQGQVLCLLSFSRAEAQDFIAVSASAGGSLICVVAELLLPGSEDVLMF